MEKGA